MSGEESKRHRNSRLRGIKAVEREIDKNGKGGLVGESLKGRYRGIERERRGEMC